MGESDFFFFFYKGHLNIFAHMQVTEDLQPEKKNYNSLLLLSLSQPFSIKFLGGGKSFRK